MGAHDNDIPPLFIVTHTDVSDDNCKYFYGEIKQGQHRGQSFIVQYNKESKSKNSESDIYFEYEGVDYHMNVFLYNPAKMNGMHMYSLAENIRFDFKKVDDNFANGAFRYTKYMDHVAYIIMTGLLVTGI
jgi:hypothetical protein